MTRESCIERAPVLHIPAETRMWTRGCLFVALTGHCRAQNNGRSTDNVRADCGFDRSNFRLAGHVDRSKFNRIENEINLRFLLFSCYLSSRCVLRNCDMQLEPLFTIRASKQTSGFSHFRSQNYQIFPLLLVIFIFFILGLWAPKRVIPHIHLTGQKRYVTEQK